jgi:hypothetical protein
MVYILLKSSTFATSQVLSTARKNKQFIHYYFRFVGIISPSATFPISSLYILQERMEDKFLHNMKCMHANTHVWNPEEIHMQDYKLVLCHISQQCWNFIYTQTWHFAHVNNFIILEMKRSHYNYSRVSFYDGSFYDDSLLWPSSNWTKHSQLVVPHCHNSIVLSLLSGLLALFQCACISTFSILVQFF